MSVRTRSPSSPGMTEGGDERAGARRALSVRAPALIVHASADHLVASSRQRCASHRRTRRNARARRNTRWRRARRCERVISVRAPASRTGSSGRNRRRPLDRVTRVRQDPSPGTRFESRTARGAWMSVRVRTHPRSSPATMRRSSTNAPRRAGASEGGHAHAGVEEA
jgi:hypothetical protein